MVRFFYWQIKRTFIKILSYLLLLVKLLVKVDSSILTLKFIKMIKLVSKNPVLRFKDGLKILKFKSPNGGINWIRNKNGNRYYTVDGFNVFENGEIWDTKTGKKVDENLTAYKNDLKTTNRLRKIIRDNKNNKSSYIKGNYPKIAKSNSGVLIYRAPDGSAVDENGDIKAKAGEEFTVYSRVGGSGYGRRLVIASNQGMEYWSKKNTNKLSQQNPSIKKGEVVTKKVNTEPTEEKQKPGSTQTKRTGSKQDSKLPPRTSYTQAAAKNTPTITYQFSRPTMLDVQGTRTDLTNDLSDADNQVNQYLLHKRGRLGTGVGWNLGYLQMFSDIDDSDVKLFRELLESIGPEGNITDEDIKNNIRYTSVKNLLEAMQDYANKIGIDIKGINNSNFVDGKWGQQSQSAWDTLKHIITRKNKDGESMAYMTGQQDSVVPPSVSQPYRSQYDYSRGTKGLRDLGIYDYNSMMNYVRSNPNAPFSTDLTNYLQNKYDKEYGKLTQKDIEQALDVKGRYRRGRNGDLDDINRTLSTYWSTKTPEEEPIVVNPLPLYSNILKNNLGEEFLNNTKKYYTTYFKKGGLISKNPVELFKAGGIMKFQGGTNSIWTNRGFMNTDVQKEIPYYRNPKYTGKGIEGSNTLEGSTSLPGITVYGSQELALLDKVRRNGRDVELAKLQLDLFKNGYFDKGTSILKAVDGINGRMTRKAMNKAVKDAENKVNNVAKLSKEASLKKKVSYPSVPMAGDPNLGLGDLSSRINIGYGYGDSNVGNGNLAELIGDTRSTAWKSSSANLALRFINGIFARNVDYKIPSEHKAVLTDQNQFIFDNWEAALNHNLIIARNLQAATSAKLAEAKKSGKDTKELERELENNKNSVKNIQTNMLNIKKAGGLKQWLIAHPGEKMIIGANMNLYKNSNRSRFPESTPSSYANFGKTSKNYVTYAEETPLGLVENIYGNNVLSFQYDPKSNKIITRVSDEYNFNPYGSLTEGTDVQKLRSSAGNNKTLNRGVTRFSDYLDPIDLNVDNGQSRYATREQFGETTHDDTSFLKTALKIGKWIFGDK